MGSGVEHEWRARADGKRLVSERSMQYPLINESER
jgi:hypothetical protein